MKHRHKEAFFAVADQFTCWLGLREPNPLSDRWIGMPGCIPKSAKCKAKTSDNPGFQCAGLVVDPTLRPEAFTPQTLSGAVFTWRNKFLVAGRLPIGFSIIDRGPEKGLVKLHGCSIYADFDLMSIVRSDSSGKFLPTEVAETRTLHAKVQPALNSRLGAPLIQHGSEMTWAEGVGARESEFVLWFGPGRRFNRWPSSMPVSMGGH